MFICILISSRIITAFTYYLINVTAVIKLNVRQCITQTTIDTALLFESPLINLTVKAVCLTFYFHK